MSDQSDIMPIPCPFCGHEHPTVSCDVYTKPPEQTHISYWGYCVACAAEGPWAETQDEAKVKWNKQKPYQDLGKFFDVLYDELMKASPWTESNDMDKEDEFSCGLHGLIQERNDLKAALERIARYDEESIWSDDRDDAADNMLTIARRAIGIHE